jgi:hypothetical protein
VTLSPNTAPQYKIFSTLAIPPVHAIATDGLLTFRGILPWDYFIEVASPIEDAYVKSVRLGDLDILADGLHVDATPSGELQVVIGRRAGKLDGRVIDSIGKPAAAFRVVLVPDEARRRRRDLYQSVLTADDGHFHFQNIPPGNYKVFAWVVGEDGAWFDKDFLHLYDDKGTAIHVDEGGRDTLEIRAIPLWY